VDDLLTVRQLQELLQVDRVTIYRMLGDGRLTGFKIGGQWRFSRHEIERWLQEQRAGLDIPEDVSEADKSDFSSVQKLPLSCIQAMQSIYAEALDVATVTTNVDGTPLTQISNSCQFCDRILATAEGRRRCQDSWRRARGGEFRLCHAGLQCAGAPVSVGGERVATVVACQFVGQPSDGDTEAWRAKLPALALELGVDERKLQAGAATVCILPADAIARVSRLLQRVAATFSEIGEERLGLLNRLRCIAEITNV